ncbi:hypothetical protein [Tautonia plasticadhaerens]|uniref:Uncharacterized protein n=1 Tax=Tautonia plasticadhaerens TaxID=2527974 RepID=A0A518GYS9_9BACT|nr:hypothetical protein [Tautonia plasticadhaerens]QDV33749.1 hypothetical protein ElP_16280 [Tautonia plasticadhaerens]
MATVAKLTVSNASQVDSANWVTAVDVFGPQLIPSSAERGDCVVEATTSPENSPAEWARIAWTGGDPVVGRPNRRLVRRMLPGRTGVGATLGGASRRIDVWAIWATIVVQTAGKRPERAKSWSAGTPFTGGESCGAFVVGSFSMGENARGQVVAVAQLAPSGVGRVISAAGKADLLAFRRQVTARDFVDGAPFASKKSFIDWAPDDSLPALLTLDPGPDDRLYDTDGPDLPAGGSRTSETYNNFRQWVEWAGVPCSNYGYWYFRARWKAQKVTLKDLGTGSIALPSNAESR